MPSILRPFGYILNSEASRRQPVAVLARVALWQIWRRGLRRPMTFKTVTSSRLVLLPGASDSLSGFWYHQLPDFEELSFSVHLLRKGDLFVDVGANQGGWTLVAAGRGARVIAFEPVPLTRERLLANLAANPPEIRTRVKVVSTGLSDESGQVGFTADLDAGNHRIRERDRTAVNFITVELAKADDILRDENPVLIKIDVEGEELGVLNGARTILAKPSLCAVVMETFRPVNYAEPALVAAEAILRENDFIPVAYDPWRRELRPLIEPFEGTQNTIYVRDLPAVRARLRRAEPVSAFGTKI